MLRHSISQIFSSNTPRDLHQQAQKDHQYQQHQQAMISSLQPSRPQLPISQHPPLNQQPIRHTSTFSSFSSLPRTQIEAMPPYQTTPSPQTFPSQTSNVSLRTILDPGKRHPVFFTDRLIKAPNGVDAGNKEWESPVTVGYVFEDVDQAKSECGARL